MFQFYKNISLFKSSRLVFEHEVPEEKTSAERRAETVKEITKDVQENRRALMDMKKTDLTIETQESDKDKLIKRDTYILIARKGEGSKHNTVGWKGLALTTDSVKILDRRIKIINGKEFVKVRLKHKLYTKPGQKDRYRTYTGYIEADKFKPEVKLEAPAAEPKATEPTKEQEKRPPFDFDQLTANFYKSLGAISVSTVPHRFTIFGQSLRCDAEVVYGPGIYDKFLIQYRTTPKGEPVLMVYSPVNIKVTDFSGDEKTMEEIAFLGQFMPNLPNNNIKKLLSIMKAHKDKRIAVWKRQIENPPRDYEPTEEHRKVKDIFAKFKKVFNKYPLTGSRSPFYGAAEGKSTWIIEYTQSKSPSLVKITLDMSTEPYVYTVNGQSTKDLDNALTMADRILQEKVGKQEKTED